MGILYNSITNPNYRPLYSDKHLSPPERIEPECECTTESDGGTNEDSCRLHGEYCDGCRRLAKYCGCP